MTDRGGLIGYTTIYRGFITWDVEKNLRISKKKKSSELKYLDLHWALKT